MFNDKDLKQFSLKGVSKKTVNKQIENFKKGFPFLNIIKPATDLFGIIKLSENETVKLTEIYETASNNERIVKFVPASGAASRMFKNLFEFKENNNTTFEDKSFNSPYNFFKKIEQFAFCDDLKSIYKKDLTENPDHKEVLQYLLEEDGLNYSNLPKGLLKFHKYNRTSRTSTEEHLVEGAGYAVSNGKINIHFTISPEHKDKFNEHLNEVIEQYEKKYHAKYQIEFSLQKSSTDTIAVDIENKAFRTADNSILFRPGGHGALIENLNDIDADIIFVKNIDNVVHDKLKEDTYKFKKSLAGLLINLRDQTFEYIRKLNDQTDEKLIIEIQEFLEKRLFTELDDQFNKRTKEEKINYLINKLDRPLRVCGMVKNEGEPGGGPFFVQKESGSVSLQIAEGAQIDMKNPEKAKIVENATHFNPVDLILSVKDHSGKAFDLRKYVDPSTGFISEKSKDGKLLKAQELPGLWNGAMANWLTVFVEVPITTFNPVKVINDLLREPHQGI